LDVHTQDIEKNAAAIVAKLSFPEQLRQAVVIAVRCHDLGKRREYFQKAVLGNNDRAVVLAKSAGKRGRLAECWRHEFWSLLDVQDDPAFSHLPDAMQDLVLHLIAAHHGRARPHFPAGEAFDPQKPADGREDPARETPRRFARLQRQYGRWGLAYLESLLRAADYAASAHPSAFVQQKKEGRP
jgi:CRISPR-associated endonuclease/helicase Cas3